MFGTLSYTGRTVNDLGMGALPFVAWRGAIGALAVLVIGQLAVLRLTRSGRAAPPWLPATRRGVLLIACLLGAAVNIAIFMAFLRTTVAVALIAFYTFPALVTLAAVPLYGERLTVKRAALLTLSGAGLALAVLSPVLSGGSLSIDPIGVGLALAAAICQASFILIAGRGFQSLPATRTALYAITAAGVAALILALAGGNIHGLTVPFQQPEAWLWVLAGGILGGAIPTTAFVAGIGLIGPSRAAILMTIEPLVGVSIAAVLLNEHPSALQFVGGAAVLVAAIALQLVPSRVPPEPEFGPLV